MENPLPLLNNNFLHTRFINIQLHVAALFLLVFTIPLIHSGLLANGALLPRYAFISTFILLTTILFLFRFYQKPVLFLNKLFFIPIIIFVWSSISLLWSLDIGNSFIEIPRFFSYLLVLFLAMQVKYYKQQNFIINGAIAGCFLVIIIGYLQAFDLNPFNIYYPGLPASTFINPNHASIYIEFFIPVLFLLLLYKNNHRTKTLYSIVLTCALSFLYILSSFGTLLAVFLALSLAVFILAKYANFFFVLKKNSRYLVAILTGAAALILIYTFFAAPALQKEKSLSSITQKHTHAQRLAIYVKSNNAIKDNPFSGFGYGAFRSGILPYISETQSITNHSEHLYYQETHNDFIQQFTETGIINGLLYISFFGIILFLGLSSLKNKKLSEKNIFIFSISSGLLVLILHAFIDFPFHLPASSLLIYLGSGFILSSTANKKIFKKDIYLKITTSIIFIFLIALLLASINYNAKHVQSNKLIRDTAIALQKEKNCNKAVTLIDKSNQLFEFDFQNQVTQAQIYGICPQNLTKQRKIINKLVYLNPTNFRARFLRGNISLIENNPSSAFRDYYYITQMLPKSALGYIGLGKWAMKVNKLKEARIFLEKAKIFAPNNYEIKFMLKRLNKKSSNGINISK